MLEIFKLLEPFVSLFLGQRHSLTEKSLKLSAEILNQLRRVLGLVGILFGSLLLFCMGVHYFIDRTLTQLDSGSFSFSPSMYFLLVFILLCLGGIMYAINKTVWTAAFKKDEDETNLKNQSQSGNNLNANPIETAVSLLILDFIKEREAKREAQSNHKNETNLP